jgi:hypothetical protein
MPIVMPHAARRKKAAEVWINPRAYATTLLHLFHDEYYDANDSPDENCYTWHPGTVLLEIRDDFQVELPQGNLDRLMAGITLVTSDRFYKDARSFVILCNVLAGELFDPASWDPADAMACAWGITEAMLLAPPEDDDEEPFAPEVLAYIGKVLDDEGILEPPDVLRIAARDGVDRRERARAALEGDPVTLANAYDMEDRKTQEINDRLREGLVELIGQLEALNLAHGDAGALAGKLARNLGRE